MATLQELLDIDGVVAAGEFSLDGSLVDFEASMATTLCSSARAWLPNRVEGKDAL